MDILYLARIIVVKAPLTSLLDFSMSCELHCWIFVGLFSTSMISLLSKLSSYYTQMKWRRPPTRGMH
jgi:hypothetical protein